MLISRCSVLRFDEVEESRGSGDEILREIHGIGGSKIIAIDETDCMEAKVELNSNMLAGGKCSTQMTCIGVKQSRAVLLLCGLVCTISYAMSLPRHPSIIANKNQTKAPHAHAWKAREVPAIQHVCLVKDHLMGIDRPGV